MSTPTGQYEVHYRDALKGQPGWWIGHHGVDLKDPEAYAEGLRKNGHVARVVDKETGEIFGQPACGMCGEPHEGVDGSCLI